MWVGYMKFSLYMAILTLLFSCTEEEDVFAPYRAANRAALQLSVDDVRTYDDLETYLRNQYGDIQPLPSIWGGSGSSDSATGPYSFRLSNGTEVSIDGIYSRATGKIIDPNFDLRTLPDLDTKLLSK